MAARTKRGSRRNAKRISKGRASAPSIRDGARLATWELLFGKAEALRRGEAHFAHAVRGGTRGGVARAVVPPGQVEALIGIWWVDPTFPIFHDIIVNMTPLGVGSAKGGDVVIPIILRRGQDNVIDWSVHHFVGDAGQGWKHRVFLKFDAQVEELESAEDKSKSKKDDVTSGQRVIHVPA